MRILMKNLVIAFLAVLAVNLSAQTTDLQYQAHVPSNSTGTEGVFSAYLADSNFNENSHINTSAFWYVEEMKVQVNNGMINVLLENIPDSILMRNQGNIFVYAYLNGINLGKLALHKVPYAVSSRFSTRSELAQNAVNSERADLARRAGTSDTAILALRSNTSGVADSSVRSAHSVHSTLADSAINSKNATRSLLSDSSIIALEAVYARVSGFSANSAKADVADSAFYALQANHSFKSDSSLYAVNANHSVYADTALYAHNSGHSATSTIASNLQDSVIVPSHIKNGSVKLNALEGGMSAPAGTYAMAGVSGLTWAVNPHHYTNSVALHTIAPASLPNTSRYIVSRVAVDYNMVTITNPIMGQIITVHNGSTANVVTLNGLTWNIDTFLNVVIPAGQSRTLWYSGTNWMVIQ
jgi:hypothetical protein